MEIIDNFLPENEFKQIQDLICGVGLPWIHVDLVADANDYSDHYFVHQFYNNYCPQSSAFELIRPFFSKLDVKALIRIRALMYMQKESLLEHKPHQDFLFPHKTALIYINTNNGFTRLADGTKVESVANRVLFTNGSEFHNSSNCTNQPYRAVLTVNYF